MAPPNKRPPPPSSSSDDDDDNSSSEEEEQVQQQQQQVKTPQKAKPQSQSDDDDENGSDSDGSDGEDSGSDEDSAPPPPPPKPTTNKPTDKPTKPPAPESDSSDEEDSGSDEDSAPPPPPPKPTANKSTDKPTKPPAPESESSEEEESGSDEDSDPQTPPPKPTTNKPSKPTAPLPNSSEEDDQESESDDDVAPPPPPKPTTNKSTKQPVKPHATIKDAGLSDDKQVDVAKRKRESPQALEGQKKAFSRVWSLNDEIAILQGLIRYRDGGGSIADRDGFYNFVRASLERDADRNQFIAKMRSLKSKFQNIFGKTKNGADPSFQNQHEKSCYELSKNLWGSTDAKVKLEDDNGEHKPKKARLSNAGVEPVSSTLTVDNSGPAKFFYLSSAVDKIASEHSCGVALKRSIALLSVDKAIALDEKVKQLKLKETKQQLRRIQLVKESVKLITDALSK